MASYPPYTLCAGFGVQLRISPNRSGTDEQLADRLRQLVSSLPPAIRGLFDQQVFWLDERTDEVVTLLISQRELHLSGPDTLRDYIDSLNVNCDRRSQWTPLYRAVQAPAFGFSTNVLGFRESRLCLTVRIHPEASLPGWLAATLCDLSVAFAQDAVCLCTSSGRPVEMGRLAA